MTDFFLHLTNRRMTELASTKKSKQIKKTKKTNNQPKNTQKTQPTNNNAKVSILHFWSLDKHFYPEQQT